jgi:hypothetical protein
LELAIPKGAGQQERERESHYAMSHHCVCSAEVIRFGSMGFFFFFFGGVNFLIGSQNGDDFTRIFG